MSELRPWWAPTTLTRTTLALSAAAVLLTIPACSGSAAAPPADSAGRAGGAAGGERGRGGGAAGAGGRGGAVAVLTAPVVERSMAVTVRSVGNVEPSSNLDIRSQVTGGLLSVGFTEGDDVSAGQVLFTLDQRPFEIQLKSAEAALARDTAQASNAAAQLTRSDDLVKRGLISPADHDASATSVAALKGVLAADAAQVENARLQLQYTSIVAPVSGRTGALQVHVGSLVRPTDAAPLVVINQMTPASVSFTVPARLLPQLQAGQRRQPLTVRASPSGDGSAPVTGTVRFIDNAVDVATDTIRVKAEFPNTDKRLWPGAFVDVALQLAVEPHAIVAPTAAIQPSQQGDFAYVVKADNTVETRQVTVARIEGGESVVTKGLQAGDVVVTDGQLKLIAGARVSTKPGTASRGQP